MPNTRILLNEIPVGDGKLIIQKMRRIRMLIDTEADFAIDAVAIGMPTNLIGLRAFCLGYSYDYNGPHEIIIKSNTSPTPQTVRHIKRFRDVQYCVEESAQIVDGMPSRFLFASAPGEDLLIRVPAGYLSTIGGGALSANPATLEITATIAYGVGF